MTDHTSHVRHHHKSAPTIHRGRVEDCPDTACRAECDRDEALARVDLAETEAAQLRDRVAELEATLREALSAFAQSTFLGEPSYRSGHVPAAMVERWQGALDELNGGH